jgi:hypothetical protein
MLNRHAPATSGFFRLSTAIAVIVFFSLAIFLGFLVGRGEFSSLLHIFGFLASIFCLIFLAERIWQVGLLVCYLGFLYHPYSFDFGPLEVSVGLGCLLAAAYAWRKVPSLKSPFLEEAGFRTVVSLLFVWILYIAGHFYFNKKDPYSPADFSLPNMVKSYFQVCAPTVMLWYFVRRPQIVAVKSGFFNRIMWLCAIGLIVNICLRLIAIVKGWEITLYTQPVRENVFALRALGPMAVLLGSVLLTSKAREDEGRGWFAVFLLLAGILGAAISGGRAALVISAAYFVAVLMFRGRWRAVCSAGLAFLLFVGVVNLSAREINSSNDLFVQRSFQWLLFQKGAASADIGSSSAWRTDLFFRAIAEWRSDARLFWFGRSTYGFGVEDEIAGDILGGYEASIQTSLRRGVTHALLSDLLVAYGLIGCVLFYAMVCTITIFLWKVYRRSTGLTASSQKLVFVALVYSIFYWPIATVGSGFFPADLMWLIIVLVADITKRPPEILPQQRPLTHSFERDHPVSDAVHLPTEAFTKTRAT